MLALLACLQLLMTVAGFEDDGPEMVRLVLDTDFLPLKLLTPLSVTPAPAPQTVTNASFGLALDTMEFHRRMMNEFLCRRYESRMIFEEIQRQLEQDESPSLPEDSLRSRMLMTDQGSSNYQGWLKRSVVLEDLYRHMDTADKGDLGDLALYTIDNRDDEYYDEEEDGDDFEDDEDDEELKIVEEEKKKNQQQKGQRVRGKHKRKKKKRPTTTTTTTSVPIDSEVASNQRDPDYADFHTEVAAAPVQEVVYEEGWIGFNMTDMYDITLTALAFLAFGIFILNVFMGIITARVGPANVMFVTNNTTPSLPVQKRDVAWWRDDGPPLERILRWVEEPSVQTQYVEEEVARLALFSLNTALFSPSQHCLHFALCASNKAARDFDGQTKFWLPIWSLGMSWLAREDNSTFPGALQNIRASALGLAGVQCDKIFTPC